jgi:Flp pilus assembly protein TadD
MKNESKISSQKAFEKGIACFNKQMFAAAIKKFTDAIELDPLNADFYYYRGLSYATKSYSNREQAIADFTKAIELNPNNDKFYYQRGILYDKRIGTDCALWDLTKAIELNSANVNAYGARAMIYEIFKKDYRKALGDLRKANTLGYGYPSILIKELEKSVAKEEKTKR